MSAWVESGRSSLSVPGRTFEDVPHVGYVDHTQTAGEALFAHALSIGLEGVVGKR
jgi:ATP-dependent DNA ligase